jgi:hypothetical protein
MADYEGERLHLEQSQILQAFGPFVKATRDERRRKIEQFIDAAFPRLFKTPGRHSLGYDVAASGEGDLAALYVDRHEGTAQWLHGLLTWRTDDWDFHDCVTHHFMSRIAGLQAAGDETGLGRQICWTLAQDFPGQFTPVNFSSEKHDMGFALMNQLATAEKRFPRNWQDVACDFFALRKTHNGGRWVFTAGNNNLLECSHCDIAWGGALSTKAGTGTPPAFIPKAFTRGNSRQIARRERAA